MTDQQLQGSINDYWTERAPSYDAYQQRPERRDLDVEAWGRVWTAALPPAPADVLDVGTGSGHVARLLAGLGHRVTGIDLSPGMLEIAAPARGRRPAPAALRRRRRRRPGLPRGIVRRRRRVATSCGRSATPRRRSPAGCVLLRPGGVVAMADSLWFTDGLGDLYGERPAGHLPLADARSIEEVADVLRRGGLTRRHDHAARGGAGARPRATASRRVTTSCSSTS